MATEDLVQFTLTFLQNAWHIWLEAAPWLLVGLVVAGILKLWVPTRLLQRWLGGRGFLPVLKAAVIGTPVPLCSCSVLPTALQLHRSGASKGSTVSFLIATPENGADSIALTYVLLGPVMTIVRPVAAIASAVMTGLLTSLVARETEVSASSAPIIVDASDCERDCRKEQGCGATDRTTSSRSRLTEFWQAVLDLLDDIAGWLLVGILLAAALDTFVPPETIARWGSGLVPMIAILLISIPMYICATASTPVAASLLAAGISPGTVLVFLLAGPATNLASAGLLRKELGTRATLTYLFGIAVTTVGLGLAFDSFLAGIELEPNAAIETGSEIVPHSVAVLAAFGLIGLAIRPVRTALGRMWGLLKGTYS